MAIELNRSKDDPWHLKTPPGTSSYTMHVDERDGRAILVCSVGSTVLHHDARCVAHLHAMLVAAAGWYGLKKGLRGRFGVHLPALLEALGLCELEHNARNNRMRAR